MKINSQDSQFDAAFDAQCREMLSKQSVDAPPMADSTLPTPRKERRLAWMAGAVVLMGVGFGLWDRGEGNAVSDAEVTVPASIVEPASKSPAVAVEATVVEAPVATSSQEELQEVQGAAPENEPKADMAEGLNSGLTDRSGAQAAESVGLVPALSEASLSATDLQAEPAANPLESQRVETSASSAPPAPKDEADAMDNAVEPAAEHPTEHTEPSSAPAGDEPVHRLPLTVPSGGGR